MLLASWERFMSNPIRILHIVTYMGRGGLETFIMNCYRHIDRDKIQFDFLVHRDFRADYDDEIEALGGRIYRIPVLNPFSISYRKILKEFFETHKEYKIVHSHLDCMSSIPLGVAKKCGIPVRIAHSHNSSQDKNLKYILKLYYKRRIPRVATELFACSKAAGEWTFNGKNFTVIKNGIEAEKFAYNPETRSSLRRELGIENSFVIGHVGRFSPQKNHDFLIDIFKEVYDREPSARLLLVGAGELETEIRDKVNRYKLSEAVIFTGIRTDVDRLMQAMDVFVMPSLYEGLPLVLVEAQSAGLTCVISADVISAEADITGNVEFVPLSKSTEHWTDVIVRRSLCGKEHSITTEKIRGAGYDIDNTVEFLTNYYLKEA